MWMGNDRGLNLDVKRRGRGADKKKRKPRIYEQTVRMQLKLKPVLAEWVWTKSDDRPSKFISGLISDAMSVEQEIQSAEGEVIHNVYDE